MARDGRKGFLASLLSGGEDPPGTTYELAVLEGADAGARYPIDRPQIQIGRRVPGAFNPDGIELNDRSVSGRHAIIGWEDGRVSIEHLPSATNPTLVNGRKVKRRRLRDGDRIVLGLVVLELRALQSDPVQSPRPSEPRPFATATDPVNVPAELILQEGVESLLGSRFPLIQRRTSIGRDEDCEIVLDVPAISRHHASLVWESDQLIVIHESSVNPTHVNGMPIRDRRRVFEGDEIRLSDRVSFQVQLTQVEATGEHVDTDVDGLETRLTSPPPPAGMGTAAPEGDPIEATVVDGAQPEDTDVDALRAPDDLDATRITPFEESKQPDDAAATRVAPLEDPAFTGDSDVTRVEPRENAAATGASEATSPPTVRDLDGDLSSADSATTSVDAPPEPAPAEPAAASPPSRTVVIDEEVVSPTDSTLEAPAPVLPAYEEGDATRIAPIPGALRSDPIDAAETIVRPGPWESEPSSSTESDAAETVIRPAPGPPAASSPTPPPVSDAEQTIVAPPPTAAPPAIDDSAATVIRPRAGDVEEPAADADAEQEPQERRVAPAETVILEPDAEDDDPSA